MISSKNIPRKSCTVHERKKTIERRMLERVSYQKRVLRRDNVDPQPHKRPYVHIQKGLLPYGWYKHESHISKGILPAISNRNPRTRNILSKRNPLRINMEKHEIKLENKEKNSKTKKSYKRRDNIIHHQLLQSFFY
jgi:hypothetical protein